MSKRAGTVVTLDDLVDAIGVDAARYALARYSLATPPIDTRPRPVDPGRPATTRSSTCSTRTPGSPSMLRNAADLGHRAAARRLRPGAARARARGRPARALGEFPRVVATAAELREPHRVARYLEELAGDLPPLLRRLPGAAAGRRGADRPAPGPAAGWSRRPASCSPTACGLLGVSAPERM